MLAVWLYMVLELWVVKMGKKEPKEEGLLDKILTILVYTLGTLVVVMILVVTYGYNIFGNNDYAPCPSVNDVCEGQEGMKDMCCGRMANCTAYQQGRIIVWTGDPAWSYNTIERDEIR